MKTRLSMIFPALLFFLCVTSPAFTSTRFGNYEFTKPVMDGGEAVFTIKVLDGQKATIFLAGSFNDWKPDALPLQKWLLDNTYSVKVKLTAGRYEYKFVIDGDWQEDYDNPLNAYDNFGGANSVLYVTASGQLDYNRPDRFISTMRYRKDFMDVGPQKAYPAKLSGFYRAQGLSLAFPVLEYNEKKYSNTVLVLKQGLVRLCETEKGVTGLVYYGEAVLTCAKESYSGKGVFLRFNPAYFEGIRKNLVTASESDAYVDCNNLFELRYWRFYHSNRDFMIPPANFVGISLSSADFTREDVFIAGAGKQESPSAATFLEALKLKPVPCSQAETQEIIKVLRLFAKAMQEKNIEILKPNLMMEEDTGIFKALFVESIYDGFRMDESSVRVVKRQRVSQGFKTEYKAEVLYSVSFKASGKYVPSMDVDFDLINSGGRPMIINFGCSY